MVATPRNSDAGSQLKPVGRRLIHEWATDHDLLTHIERGGRVQARTWPRRGCQQESRWSSQHVAHGRRTAKTYPTNRLATDQYHGMALCHQSHRQDKPVGCGGRRYEGRLGYDRWISLRTSRLFS